MPAAAWHQGKDQKGKALQSVCWAQEKESQICACPGCPKKLYLQFPFHVHHLLIQHDHAKSPCSACAQTTTNTTCFPWVSWVTVFNILTGTLWLFNIAMVYVLKMVIFHGYVSHNQMVHLTTSQWLPATLPPWDLAAWHGNSPGPPDAVQRAQSERPAPKKRPGWPCHCYNVLKDVESIDWVLIINITHRIHVWYIC